MSLRKVLILCYSETVFSVRELSIFTVLYLSGNIVMLLQRTFLTSVIHDFPAYFKNHHTNFIPFFPLSTSEVSRVCPIFETTDQNSTHTCSSLYWMPGNFQDRDALVQKCNSMPDAGQHMNHVLRGVRQRRLSTRTGNTLLELDPYWENSLVFKLTPTKTS